MIITIDVEKAFNKIQCQFVLKKTHKWVISEYSLCPIKKSLRSQQVTSYISKKLETFLLRSEIG